MFAAVSTIITSAIAYRVLYPPPAERFFAMWILGSNGLAEHYYPDDNPNLTVGNQVNWTLGVYNHMGALEYVVVRVKLLNSTLSSPNELAGNPSSVSPMIELTRILVDNETWSAPFVWKILGVSLSAGNVSIDKISINGIPFLGQLAQATSGYNYRFVFELWFYDEAAGDLSFSWRTGEGQRAVWTQIWFNVTYSTQ